MQNDSIPPSYGMTTSNTAECTNSISLDLRNDKPWLGIIEGMVDVMSVANSKRHQLYKSKDPNEVVPWVKELLELRVKAAARMDIIEVEEGKNEFAVTEYWDNFVKKDNDEIDAASFTKEKKTKHVLYPNKKWCTCGKWQTMKFPCRHEITYYIKWLGWELQMVLDTQVHYYFRYKALQSLYKPNICPVVSDTLDFDGTTLPPIEKKGTGRPKKKRYRRRSKHVDISMSTIKCSNCGERGHNKRLCKKSKKAETTAKLKDDANYG